ncbi:CK5P3 protein, partial [Tyrannus savana]|nr:CK5P3 protein [Tyrannus savana]
DWLVDRRHCSLRWQSQVQLIRHRIDLAIRDMPENQEIKQLLEGSYLHYFHCLRIVEILKGTEASTKNLFGRYSSQRMKVRPGLGGLSLPHPLPPPLPPLPPFPPSCPQDWQEIVALYEKENTYLEGDPPEGWCPRVTLPRRPQGDNVRQELLALVQDLPSLLSRVGAAVGGLGEAIELYRACVGFVCDSPGEAVVPLLSHVCARGNSTVLEWRTGREPRRVERPELREEPPEPPREDTIDWGDFPLDSPPGGDGGAAQGGEEIDWGITVEPGPQEGGIDWGDGGDEQVQITVLEDGAEVPEEGVARGSDALTVLEYPETRNQFIDELMELELFLAQRLAEMEDEADIVAMSQLQLAPALLQGQTSAHVGALLGTARALLAQLCSRSVQHLCMILASPRYVERVSELLRQKLRQAELLLAKKEVMAQKRREALAEQAALEPKLDRLVEKTKELQKLIEADISKRYGGRPVNLMGISL